MSALLELRDLTIDYRSRRGLVPAVRGVNLTLEAGQTLGMAGESGCGKSTLAMSVLRLLPKTAVIGGEVLLDGEDVRTMSWGRLRAVRWAGASVVFQGAMHALNPVLRIGDQLAEPITLHGGAGAKSNSPADVQRAVGELLERVGLPRRHAKAYPHELSGGQKQRVMIAMALACGPRLVIADEPTTALDVMVQAQVLTLLGELVRESGIGLMMISHDLSVLAQTCQRLAVMYAGRMVELGPSAQVMHESAHPYSKALAAAFPTVGDPASRMAPQGLPGDPPDPTNLPSGCPFHPRCPVSTVECEGTDVLLRQAGPEHQAACVRVPESVAETAGEPV
ncbi:ABC transporter ATP-binding protein [Allokutzneria albata]|uniref:Oligopeptide/dipeptide ABC transporter, ATP-binding protein, C-terminal domain-containing protein n=1 Tax=Allokutzneria albata TaxID=211114 RepID=A0A1G9TFB9_ALLAB|nr:ABC transporter ATP-binding protein [Allokutzneria albata]SDM46288.1 oligopeptide/dipeptide ABC transporter, ATP-binding protein, C-terminal domain-containing protein [Allokutzneria albata]